MADLDVSELIDDPDFCDTVILRRRYAVIDTKGRNTITATETEVIMTVESGPGSFLKRFQDDARMTDSINVWYRGILQAAASMQDGSNLGVYPDVIIWNGRTYQVDTVDNWNNYGSGYCHALCLFDGVNNRQ